jgi:hypothetical protein
VKSLKEFGLNLKRKSLNWKRFEKEKEKKTKEPPYLSAQPACRPTSSFPRRPTPSLSFSFLCSR